jgi:hypothetical protein
MGISRGAGDGFGDRDVGGEVRVMREVDKSLEDEEAGGVE